MDTNRWTWVTALAPKVGLGWRYQVPGSRQKVETCSYDQSEEVGPGAMNVGVAPLGVCLRLLNFAPGEYRQCAGLAVDAGRF